MPRSPEDELEALEQAGLRRRLRVLDSPQGPEVIIGGRTFANFSSNDYLGLATHPALVEAAMSAASKYGFGSGASRLVCGTHRPHVVLEETLAAFKGTEAALAFGSGFATGTGVLTALLRKGDVVILDKLSHACLIDGAKASGATLRVFAHNRTDQLESILRSTRASLAADARVIVVTESVFSMDGDLSPLAEIVELKDRHGAWLLLDEAHSTGVLGPHGRGLAAALGLSHRIELQMGTLSKALGCHGGFVAASRPIVELLINRARPFIYATAPPPALAAAATAAIGLVASPAGDALRDTLHANSHSLAGTLGLEAPSPSPILPFIIGMETEAVATSVRLEQLGVLVPAIRYPTVAKGSARLRFTISAAHTPAHFSALARALPALHGSGN